MILNSVRRRIFKPTYTPPGSNNPDKSSTDISSPSKPRTKTPNQLPRNSALSLEEAKMRRRFIKSVDYTVIFVLNMDSKDAYHVTVSIAFELNVNPKQIDLQTQLFLDFNANEIEEFYINGVMVTDADHHWKDSRLTLKTELLKQRNFIEISYNGTYRQLGSGLISLQDSSEEQYIYTMSHPFTAHHIYPCFDQLDIKGTFKLVVLAPEEWKVFSNQKT